jgi:hypothetical protein
LNFSIPIPIPYSSVIVYSTDSDVNIKISVKLPNILIGNTVQLVKMLDASKKKEGTQK